MCRATMAAAMTGKNIGDKIKEGNTPSQFKKYGTTVEEIFADLPDLKALYGVKAAEFSTGAIGAFSFLNKIGFGVRHFGALNRKFNIKYFDQTDLIPLTEAAAKLLK
jgi:hypothetical protein